MRFKNMQVLSIAQVKDNELKLPISSYRQGSLYSGYLKPVGYKKQENTLVCKFANINPCRVQHCNIAQRTLFSFYRASFSPTYICRPGMFKREKIILSKST